MFKNAVIGLLIVSGIPILGEEPANAKWAYAQVLAKCSDKTEVTKFGEQGWEMVGFSVLIHRLK